MSHQTLTRYLLGLQRNTPSPSYAEILSAVAQVVKQTAVELYRGPTADQADGEWTRQLRRGAKQQLHDQVSDLDALAAVSIAGDPQFRALGEGSAARYLLLADPLHRHVLLQENQPVGFAFSILDRREGGSAATELDFMQPGKQQVCAGMALYGPTTMLVLTTGNGVDCFLLNRDTGDFVLTTRGARIPEHAYMFAINASEASRWAAPIKRYVDECVQGAEGPRGHDFVMRWNASAIIGVFRTLVRGGVFLVPDTGKKSAAWGVPLLHNAAPLSWIIEQAGGASTTGTKRVLDIIPDSLTTRVPLICGDDNEVRRIERYHQETTPDDEPEQVHPLFRSRTLFAE